MADNIAQLQKNPALRMNLGRAAKQSLHDNGLSAKGMAGQYEAVLERIFTALNQSESRSKTIPLDCPKVRALLDAA